MQPQGATKGGANIDAAEFPFSAGREASGQAQVRRSLLAGALAATLVLLTALAAGGPARAQSLGGVGGAGLNPGGNGGGSNQNGGNGSTGATFGAKGLPIGGAGGDRHDRQRR
jgi:hypothetical protein